MRNQGKEKIEPPPEKPVALGLTPTGTGSVPTRIESWNKTSFQRYVQQHEHNFHLRQNDLKMKWQGGRCGSSWTSGSACARHSRHCIYYLHLYSKIKSVCSTTAMNWSIDQWYVVRMASWFNKSTKWNTNDAVRAPHEIKLDSWYTHKWNFMMKNNKLRKCFKTCYSFYFDVEN